MQSSVRKTALWLQAAVIAGAGLLPVLLMNSASAATVQLINREARVTNATPGASFNITFEFDTPVNAGEDVEAIELEFVDDPLAQYAGLPANTPTLGAPTTASQNNWDGATAFSAPTVQNGDNYTGGGSPNNQILVTRTDATAEDNNANLNITFNGLTHNAAANTTFYVRLRLYNDASTRNASTLVFDGAVASSTSQTLNVSARVQERLEFCVGSTAVNDATSSPGADCSAITGTNVDLGVVDNSAVNVTPVALIDGGNNTNGIAMVNTNAINGTVISYAAMLESGVTSGNGGGRLKIDGAGNVCPTAGSVVDPCINSVGATQAAITSGVEDFGMTIAGINCGSSGGVAYTCAYASGDVNLAPLSNYIGDAFTQYTSGTFGTTNGFAWLDDGTYTNIASSGSSTVKVLDDEALILKFGATASATTPTGQYDVDVDFVAVPTF